MPHNETEYRTYTEHLSTCDDCENGEPVPPDEDYICPEGLRLKAAWLGGPPQMVVGRTPVPSGRDYSSIGAAYRGKGLIPQRYVIARGDGKPVDPEALFFVLRYDKPDEWGDACRGSLRDFANRIRDSYPELSDDLHAAVVEAERRTLQEGP